MPYCLTLACALLLAGCFPLNLDDRRNYKFRVIDEATSTPLSGVSVIFGGDGHHLGNRLFPGGEYYELGMTGADGIVIARGVISNNYWQYLFGFHKAGYRRLNIQGNTELPS